MLWITDTGGQILKCEMDGAVLASLTKKDFNYAEDDPFVPTALDVDPATGNVWITDGYGSSRVHRFSPGLKLELTLDGTAGAGRFACPHWVHCDTRQKQTRIYVADRSNDRIQVFNPDGTFIKCIGDGLMTPSAFAPLGEFLAVAELKARGVILDADDAIVGEIGNGREYVKREGWPNRLDANGSPACALDGIAEGKFNSPHGMTSDAEGSLYVSEWLIGDRYIKLQRVA
jgi:DNA-binding beta-propeller fold protein YncE